MADTISVFCTNGVKEVVLELFPEFEHASGSALAVTYGPTAGIMNKIRDGAAADVYILTLEAIEELAKLGKAAGGSRVDLARSFIGIGVRTGTKHPEIGTVGAFKQSLLSAKSIAYSKLGLSGIYFPSVLERLGIVAEMKPKTVLTEGISVGHAIVRGDAELGIQQISELLPVEGIEVVGPIPDELQKITIFSVATAASAKDSAKALTKFLANGFDPVLLEKLGLEAA